MGGGTRLPLWIRKSMLSDFCSERQFWEDMVTAANVIGVDCKRVAEERRKRKNFVIRVNEDLSNRKQPKTGEVGAKPDESPYTIQYNTVQNNTNNIV